LNKTPVQGLQYTLPAARAAPQIKEQAMKIRAVSAAVVAMFAFAGVQAQGLGGIPSSDTTTSVPENQVGTNSMPAEITPEHAVGASGTSDSTLDTRVAPYYTQQVVIPSRASVQAEASAMNNAGLIVHGDLSVPRQDRGTEAY
jgi:hypothetical protein